MHRLEGARLFRFKLDTTSTGEADCVVVLEVSYEQSLLSTGEAARGVKVDVRFFFLLGWHSLSVTRPGPNNKRDHVTD